MLKTPEHSSGSSKPKPASLFISMSTFMALCAERAGRVSRKLKAKTTRKMTTETTHARKTEQHTSPTLTSRPKQLLSTISNKAIRFMHPKKVGEEGTDAGRTDQPEEWGDGGVWQKTILMGDKCEPLNFSGVIYYDSYGNQLNEVPPRSPRASPLPGYLTRAGKSEL
ncbi:hypothetical protein I3843_15G105300 [Carya illinoinensis]|uniref:Uncharacterized protein n=1 Tax=Carya illinoinensis TaxID=32201 RepID=A0A922ABF3_CARIL|nr:hypothetical protein I3760_15G107700 [Carya illinoinensis]KAG6675591.1 hypothetical protein I3842_15G111000 [Carya illinoinensis]KAG7944489.1 hypothetical protein I3843_15G105300 [Carya illinoinensis]